MKIYKRLITAFLLLVILISGFYIRTGIFQKSRLGDFMPFVNINAFHYYFAKEVAEAKLIGKIDYNIQYPEGLYIARSCSIFMEYLVGYLYRLLDIIEPFDEFVRNFVRVFGILAVIIVFFLTKSVYRTTFGALISSAFYGICLAGINRTAGFSFMRENFALPIIFMHIWLFVEFLRDRKDYNLVLSGIFLYIAFASWEFTQFYYIALLSYALTSLFSTNKKDVFKIIMVFSFFSVLAGVSVTYLKSGNFLISWPMLASYSLIITYFVKENFKLQKHTHIIIIFFVFLLAGILSTLRFSKDLENYSHVYQLALHQIRFFGRKPANPTLLFFDAKLLWEAAHKSPPFGEFISNFGLILFSSIFAISQQIKELIRGKLSGPKLFLLYFTFVWFLLYLLVNRLGVFLVFFLCIYIGAFIGMVKRLSHKRLAAVFFLVILLIESTRVTHIVADVTEEASIIGLIDWAKNNTTKDDVILAPPRYSPPILAYAQRKIILHPKLEAQLIRQKTKLWAQSLFEEDEEPLYNLCRNWGADYFVFPSGTYSNTGPSSWRYITGNLKANPNCIAYKLEGETGPEEKFSFSFEGKTYAGRAKRGFQVMRLKHFILVHKDSFFKVYMVRP